jgi:hypothetical protein
LRLVGVLQLEEQLLLGAQPSSNGSVQAASTAAMQL